MQKVLRRKRRHWWP